MQYLTCLNNVKTWLNISTMTDDDLLSNMIIAFTDAIMSYCERATFAATAYQEMRDGVGNQRMTLRNWPVIAVSAVQVFGGQGFGGNQFGQSGLPNGVQNIPASSGFGNQGFTLEPWDGSGAGSPQRVILSGYNYPRGTGNVQITYRAGYQVSGEAQSVPPSTAYTLQPNCPYGPFLADSGPTYANGTALTLVSALTGTAGQYTVAVDAPSQVATYTFNSTDANAAILLNYSYVPASVERACIQWVGEQYSYRKRIGLKSQSANGVETSGYDTKDMPDFIAAILKPYAKWIPL